MIKLTTCSLLVLAACTTEPVEPPNPPDPWGVPISGGTLLMSRDGTRAIIGDPDRDRIVTLDVGTGTVTSVAALLAGDEPGRIVEDGAGRFHAVLRRGGVIAQVDVAAGTVTQRRAVCAEPRGLAWNQADDSLYVACTDGRLITLPAAGGDATRTIQLDRDLRDVIVSGSQIVVTRFRTAELITLDAAGAVVSRGTSPSVLRDDFGRDQLDFQQVNATAEVAWRTIAMPDGRIVMSHQRRLEVSLGTGNGQSDDGYGAGCGGGPVEDAITVMTPGQAPLTVAPAMIGALPVDIAASPDGQFLSIVSAGQQVVRTVFATNLEARDTETCPFPNGDAVGPIFDGLGIPTSIAYAPNGTLYVYYPEAPALVAHVQGSVEGTIISLPGTIGYDAGRELFHTAAGVGIACASCHPEARDDGQVWTFDGLGARRTQVVAGNILARAPYHWNGDQADLGALVAEVFESRMAGSPTTPAQRTALGKWLDRIPAPAPITGDVDAVARGKAIFDDNAVGCAACHSGPLYTTNALVDVGTGGLFKVPSLKGVGARAPFIHTGCAATLLDRLTNTCGGGDQHGHTSQLTTDQLSDLVAYLESL